MVFPNRIDKLDFPDKQRTAIDMLKDFMIIKSITVIEYDDFFFGVAIVNDEPDLAMFRYKKEDIKIVSHKNLDHDMKLPIPKRVLNIQSYRYF